MYNENTTSKQKSGYQINNNNKINELKIVLTLRLTN